ncbi:MAG: endo,3,4-beta glycanase [Caulobacter sp.]|nr:endo,3,4-beta glycanase [Caulobacter sp.]
MNQRPHRARSRLAAARPALLAAGLLAVALSLSARQAVSEGSPPPLRVAPDGRPLTLSFAEEFDRPLSLWDPERNPTGRWRPDYGHQGRDGVGSYTLVGNGELQIYVSPYFRGGRDDAPANPFRTEGGTLSIVAQRSNHPQIFGYKYTSGLITTRPSFAQTYGYFEMRARLPRGKGVWPAFWLLPADGEWPPEIDVMESVGDPSKAYVTAHSKLAKAVGVEVKLTPDQFHIFAVAWDAKQLVWYVDGREAARQSTPADLNKPMFMLANLALGGDWAGTPDATTPFPAKFTIDYIRGYRFGS